jgi:hypothetical protein
MKHISLVIVDCVIVKIKKETGEINGPRVGEIQDDTLYLRAIHRVKCWQNEAGRRNGWPFLRTIKLPAKNFSKKALHVIWCYS